ncbi:MAG: leucine-rich repeat domain-containing protein [Tepidisphaeraceae bacterium]
MSSLGLTALPPEIGSLTALMGLNLSGNRLSTLPSVIRSLTALTTLSLSNNQLSTLPPEIGSLTALESLDLINNQLSTLPPEIGSLTALMWLNLNVNQLSTLPPEIGSLTALTELYLGDNQLSTLPPEIGSLTALTRLGLSGNQLSTLPPEIGSLTALEVLDLSNNQLSTLPPEIGSLRALTVLDLSSNQLSTLPPEIGSLTALTRLYLNDNQLSTLPPVIGSLPALTWLGLNGNPLPAEWLAVLETSGIAALLEVVRGQAQATIDLGTYVRFDEAKLLLLGPGQVGKTWLLQALSGKKPEKTDTTKGIEIDRWRVDVNHPRDRGRRIHLNCWDFGGQDHYQVTHQIFFSQKAIYLMVWNPRGGLDPKLNERLDRIKLSAGSSAKVLIVSTHADGTSPAMPLGERAIRDQFGSLIWGFYQIDSKNGPTGTGIATLKREIAKAAAQLEGMDAFSPLAWRRARKAIRDTKKRWMMFDEFKAICSANGIAEDRAAGFAEVLEVQGHAVFIADAASDTRAAMSGNNIVVLDPQWLAQAIAHVIEDKETIEGNGELVHARLKEIWKKNPKRGCVGYDPELHGYLLWLMKRFFIAYELTKDSSLVPELIATNRPDDVRWTPTTKAYNHRQARLVYEFGHEPPIGIIPALTAAMHPERYRGRTDNFNTNWKGGFFLSTELRGDAYVELVDRRLWIEVRDRYPNLLITLVNRTLCKIAAERFPQLVLEERVPCMGVKDGKPCPRNHKSAFLETMRGKHVQCDECGSTTLDANAMLDGFDAREHEFMQKLEGLADGQREMVASAHAIFTSLDPENLSRRGGPSMFTILPGATKWYKKATHESVGITCWCEHPNGPHPVTAIGSGEPPDYLLTMPRDWLKKVTPYMSWAAKLLRAFSGVALHELTSAIDDKECKEQLKAMDAAAKSMMAGDFEPGSRRDWPFIHRERPEITALGHLHDFLKSQVPKEKPWGDLLPVQTNSGQLLWLCSKHRPIQQPEVKEIR